MTNLLSVYQTLKEKEWVNLSQITDEYSPHFPGFPPLKKEDLYTIEKNGFHVHQLSVVAQYGTHIDAPCHFIKGGRQLADIPLKDLLLPLYVIDKSQEVAKNNDYEITKQDILDFEQHYGKIEPNAFVAFRSDWSKRWPNHDKFRNLDDNNVQRTPGWSIEALKFLIHERFVKAIGHETLDTDAGLSAFKSNGLPAEYYLLSQDIYQVEVLTNLDKVTPVGSIISISAPNFANINGYQVRAIAILP